MGSADEDGSSIEKAMALGGRTTCRSCDLCGDQPACWDSVADKVYFCNFWDASVHTVNSVGWRHNRLKTIPEYRPKFEMRMGTPPLEFKESAGALREFEEEMGFECLIGNQSADEELVCLQFCRPTARAVSSHSCGTEFMGSCVPTENETDFSKGSDSLGDDKGDTPHSFLCGGITVKVEDTSVDVLEINNVKVEEAGEMKTNVERFESKEKAIRLMLRLNYQDVLTAWSNRGSLWADDNPIQTLPEADAPTSDGTGNPLECGVVPESGSMGNGGQSKGPEHVPVILTSNVREAQVTRYREKRRSRLFSKKIRYQVRKLNAEKRPRMKGRFVKRSASSICLEGKVHSNLIS